MTPGMQVFLARLGLVLTTANVILGFAVMGQYVIFALVLAVVSPGIYVGWRRGAGTVPSWYAMAFLVVLAWVEIVMPGYGERRTRLEQLAISGVYGFGYAYVTKRWAAGHPVIRPVLRGGARSAR